jgi:hypothetical protein
MSFDWGDVPERPTVDKPGLYRAEIKDLEWQVSKDAEKLMLRVQFQVTEGDHAGASIFDRYVFGSDDDPGATEASTWLQSIGLQRLRDCLRAAKADLVSTGDPRESVEVCVRRAVGNPVVISVKEDKKNPGYFNVVRFYSPDAALQARGGTRTGSAPTATGPRTCPRCSETVERADFAAHVQRHKAEEAA